MNLSLGNVMLYVKDIKSMVAFYRDVLGFPVIPTSYDPNEFVVLDAGNAQFSLHQIPAEIARQIVIADPPEARSKAPVKIMFICEDVEGMRERLAAKGALMGPLENYPPLSYCDGKDPEGNIFQITNNRTSERVN